MTYTSGLGTIDEPDDKYLGKDDTLQWDAKFLQISNCFGPANPNDCSTKIYHDLNSIKILNNPGDLIVYNINNAAPMSVGSNHQILVVDTTADNNLNYKTNLIELGNFTFLDDSVITINMINKGNSDYIAIDDKIRFNTSGTTSIFQIGSDDIPSPTNYSELVMIARRDCSIFLMGDSDSQAVGDSTFICHTVYANSLFSCLNLDKTSHNLNISVATDGTLANPLPSIVFQVNGIYSPISDQRPSPSGYINAMTIDFQGHVDIPEKLNVGEINCVNLVINDAQVNTNVIINMNRILLTDTTTLSINDLMTGLILGTPSINSTYTLPTSIDIISNIAEPEIDMNFKFTVVNLSPLYYIKLIKNSNQVILTAEAIGGEFSRVLPLDSVTIIITIINVNPSNESIDIIKL